MIFQHNKRGIFFTLDAMLAMVILVIFLITASNFLSTNTSVLKDSAAIKLAKDVNIVLIESDLLSDDLIAVDYTATSLYLNTSIPIQFGSYVKVTPESSSSFLIEGQSCQTDLTYSYKSPLRAGSTNYLIEVTLC